MTQKIYRSARGKTVDVGALRLQNETVRAVGNMGVNARGDRIDAQGNIIDPIGQQIQRRIQKQTNVSDGPVHSSSRSAQAPEADNIVDPTDTFALLDDLGDVEDTEQEVAAPVVSSQPQQETQEVSGLAAAIAKAKSVKQELDQTAQQKSQSTGVKKI